MNFLIDNWFLIILAIAALCVGGVCVYHFVKLPTEKQIKQIKEWLLYAVALAERELGEKTGILKLRFVYDMFLTQFTFLSKVVSFELFSQLVDEVLETFRHLLESNSSIANFIVKEKGE